MVLLLHLWPTIILVPAHSHFTREDPSLGCGWPIAVLAHLGPMQRTTASHAKDPEAMKPQQQQQQRKQRYF